MKKNKTKHFLDTSVVRKYLNGTRAYKEYLSNYFNDEKLYVSPYVQMEFRRGLIRPLISFLSVLDMDHIDTIGDAMTFWSNEFKSSRLKVVLELSKQLFETEKIDLSNPSHKPEAIRAIGRIIKRLDANFDQFINLGTDSSKCARALVPLKISMSTLKGDLKNFTERFDDVEACRSKCTIDKFLLEKRSKQVQRYVREAANVQGRHAEGFKKVARNLQDVQDNGASACTCKRCESIGDAVITLDMTPNYILEHIDQSFEYLCDLIGQPHHLHPSESALVKGHI